jgi:hypothetical protein
VRGIPRFIEPPEHTTMEPKHSTLLQAALIALVLTIIMVGQNATERDTEVAQKVETAQVR